MNTVQNYKAIVAGVLLLLAINISAEAKLATKDQVEKFFKSKTCIVLENGIDSYNFFIKESAGKFWNITEFEFIDQAEFETRRTDPSYSFLMMLRSVYDKDPGGVSYDYINLVLGDSATDVSNMPELCSIPVSYADNQPGNYSYVMPVLIKFIQIHVKNLQLHRTGIVLSGLKYYNKAGNFNNKILLINEDDLAGNANSPEKIKTVFPHTVKITNDSEIQEELSTNKPSLLFLFHIGPSDDAAAGKCFEMIFDSEGNLYYFNNRMITNDNEDGFNLSDFYRIK